MEGCSIVSVPNWKISPWHWHSKYLKKINTFIIMHFLLYHYVNFWICQTTSVQVFIEQNNIKSFFYVQSIHFTKSQPLWTQLHASFTYISGLLPILIGEMQKSNRHKMHTTPSSPFQQDMDGCICIFVIKNIPSISFNY